MLLDDEDPEDREDRERERRHRRVMAPVNLVYGEDKCRYEQAFAFGPLELVRLRADWPLRHGDAGEIRLSGTEREELARIVAAPGDDDGYWLSSEFDDRLDELAEG
jgi:hypothetical protein